MPADTVARKKKTKPARPGVPLHVWLDPWLRDAIEAARRKTRRSLREEVSVWLERIASELGYSPPAEKNGK